MGRYNVTVPDGDKEWLDSQEHLSPAGLLQKAIQDQQAKERDVQDIRPNGGRCPFCKRDYRYVLTLTSSNSVVRGQIAGDVCIGQQMMFLHSELTIDAPPQLEDKDLANRAVSGVWSSDGPADKHAIVMPATDQ